MSDIIHLLPDSVANQIAAGEVIQRPASLVKELVENSIDAGATKVQVVITDAGKTCVQVVDNGKGMSETDARLSFERHATSKIQQASDLFSLQTMGFRGEALASIAAVAQVELRTRLASEELGVSVQIEGSKFINQEPIACPVGANFIVRNLFFNVPARRKFLKSNHTEHTNIIVEFERIALAHPDISFTLSTPDNILLDLPAGNFRQRIVSIFGRKIDKYLMPVQVETGIVEMVGFVGNPESRKKKGAQQFFFTNGRYMRHPYFSKAVQAAYDRLIPDGEQVPFFLQLIIDPSKIDVNIHPTKTEIKFEDEIAIWQVIRAAVRESLAKFNAIPTIDFNNESCPEIPVFSTESGNPQMPKIKIDPTYNPFATSATKDIVERNSSGLSNSPSTKGWETAFEDITFQEHPPKENRFAPSFEYEKETTAPTLYDDLSKTEKTIWELATSNFLQYKGRYLITTTENGLLIVDQHRAHTRILFEEFLQKINMQDPQTQGLLFPDIIELIPIQLALLQTIEEELTSVGFDISYLGGNSYSILGVPAGLDGVAPVHLLQSVIDDAEHKGTTVKEEIVHTITLSLAKKAAIPVGQALTKEEIHNLLTRLFACDTHTFTPDGKVIHTQIPNALLIQNFN